MTHEIFYTFVNIIQYILNSYSIVEVNERSKQISIIICRNTFLISWTDKNVIRSRFEHLTGFNSFRRFANCIVKNCSHANLSRFFYLHLCLDIIFSWWDKFTTLSVNIHLPICFLRGAYFFEKQIQFDRPRNKE